MLWKVGPRRRLVYSVWQWHGTELVFPLQWRHNERNGVSNHQPYDCLLYRLFKAQIKKNHQRSASLAFVRGSPRWPMNSSHKGPVTRKMFPFDDVIMFPEDVTKQWDFQDFKIQNSFVASHQTLYNIQHSHVSTNCKYKCSNISSWEQREPEVL